MCNKIDKGEKITPEICFVCNGKDCPTEHKNQDGTCSKDLHSEKYKDPCDI